MRLVFTLLAGLLLVISVRAFGASDYDPTPWTEDEVRVLMHRMADGDVEALFLIGQAMLIGDRLRKDEANGLRYLEQAVEKNYAPAMLRLAWWYSGFRNTDYDRAYRYLERAAATNDPEASFHFAEELEKGRYEEQAGRKWSDERREKIRALYIRAAELGHAEAMFYLADKFLRNPNDDPRVRQGIDWLQRSAAAGYPAALELLAQLHTTGKRLLPRDLPKAIDLHKQALDRLADHKSGSKHGVNSAMLNRQIAELQESLTPPNIQAALEHYAKVRDGENTGMDLRRQAHGRIVRIYAAYGNAEQAQMALREAEQMAESDYMPGMCLARDLLAHGREGVPVDQERATQWHQRLVQSVSRMRNLPADCADNAECTAKLDKEVSRQCGWLHAPPLD